MPKHISFEWDNRKAEANRRKHSPVTFEMAEVVLRDPEADKYHVEKYDDAHSQTEQRMITFGAFPQNRQIVLQIVWTERAGKTASGFERRTRIISARLANAEERKDYGKEISGR